MNLLSTEKKIKVIRMSNHGFDIKPYHQNTTLDFLNVTITDLNQSITISSEQAKYNKNNKIVGCFCFLDKFDESQLDTGGNLSFRIENKRNIGYLPADEIVFVRNTLNNKIADRFVYGFETDTIHPITQKPITERFGGFTYEFVKMPLWLAIQRLNEHIKNKNGMAPDEVISEFYLTEEQVKNKLILKEE
ncbi:hypothetical protein [Stenotrophomonas maltophilia group sp. RNC7]|uniref:hypothetical protein n=1 Tax=Stenotrophomonas maltophilia group sp. RNC7 TaxID=3071467 RepID=UPI0027E05E4D|nr:hypothetical protein [Stenotrophomonas maltophilia group sp. RNC7]MDQ4682713.1 hypothetical protein [Stenotrophomonas maltophilia group sp. RNC7]